MNKILQGDCLEKLKELEENSVDSIVTDPPYELGFMGKSWDNTGIANNPLMWAECLRVLKPGGYLLSFGGTRTYHRMACAIEDAGFEVRDMIEWIYSTGFPKSLNLNKALQKKCTCGNMVEYDNERTKQNTESSVRLMSNTDLSQGINIEKEQGEILQSGLSEQSLSLPRDTSSYERRKEPSVEGRSDLQKTEGELQGGNLSEMSKGLSTNGTEGWIYNATPFSNGTSLESHSYTNGSGASHRPQSEQQQDREPCAFCKQLGTQETRRLYEATYGVGSALKPAHEPICVARKPLSEKTLVYNFIKYGTGGINIDESRVETEDSLSIHKGNLFAGNSGIDTKENFETKGQSIGRFPANLIHDNSEEVRECFPESTSGAKKANQENYNHDGKEFVATLGASVNEYQASSGNASRFFKSIIYQAKASKSERNKGCEELEDKDRIDYGGFHSEKGLVENNRNPENRLPNKNNHPTVKPIALMEYLIKMVTPKGGTVLDPFAGSGTTGVACKNLNRNYILIEKEPEYIEIIKKRLE